MAKSTSGKHFHPLATDTKDAAKTASKARKNGTDNSTDATPSQQKKLSFGVKAVLIIAMLLALIYAAGTAWFSTHFTYGTKTTTLNLSNLTQSELQEKVTSAASSWKLTISGQNFNLTIPANDISYQVDSKTFVQDVSSAHNPFLWPYYLISQPTFNIEPPISYDKEALTQKITSAVEEFNQTATPPTNATLTFDTGEQAFVITPQAYGTALNADLVIKAADEAITSHKDSLELTQNELEPAAVLQDNPALAKAKETANTYLAQNITLTKGGTELLKLDAATISGWVTLSDTQEVNLDTEKIKAWANDTLSAQIARSDEENDYALDGDTLAQAIASQIVAQNTAAIEIPAKIVETRPKETPGARERGRHIDVNLSTQYARFYDENGTVIWRSQIVTGNTSQGMGTPEGTFSINAKKRNQTLIGADANEDGEPDYKTPVDYWMPFQGNMIGFHDATWRTRFGGSIYSYAGSHGCVNLPPANAAKLYDLVKVGDKVYVHS